VSIFLVVVRRVSRAKVKPDAVAPVEAANFSLKKFASKKFSSEH